MTEVRQQSSAVRNQRQEINRRDAECAEHFFCGLYVSVVKPLSDLRLLISGLFALLFALSFPAEAQQATNVHRIGYLTNASLSSVAARTEAFRQGLRELGYVEGKNIVIEW